MADFQDDFGGAARDHLRRVEEGNAAAVDTVARRVLRAVTDDHIVHTVGSGHSLGLVLETFYRAGGLACVRPIFHPALLPLFGAQSSSQFERVPGIAANCVGQAGARPGDVGFVFSNSGVNAFPVEVADELAKREVYVVGVLSRPHMEAAPRRAHAKLGDIADIVLDTMIPPGDAVVPTAGGTTAALSSLCTIYLWDLLLTRLARLADEAGVKLPLWQSANVPGGDAANAGHMTRYRKRIPYL
ncbi:MAG: sugar isomerase domain-containing protein [Streptosporangiales bacterium]|nr:sugar isomerase domain-containing protein [Streptosporangiales bacterium]